MNKKDDSDNTWDMPPPDTKVIIPIVAFVVTFLVGLGIFFYSGGFFDPEPTCRKSSTQAIEVQGELVDVLICEDPLYIIKEY